MTAIVSLKMGEALGTSIFPCLVLDLIMIRIEHDMLTKFVKMKPLIFVGFETKDKFKFIVNYNERLDKISIVEQHGVEFVTFQLQVDAK